MRMSQVFIYVLRIMLNIAVEVSCCSAFSKSCFFQPGFTYRGPDSPELHRWPPVTAGSTGHSDMFGPRTYPPPDNFPPHLGHFPRLLNRKFANWH